jgi:hypothetical protein
MYPFPPAIQPAANFLCVSVNRNKPRRILHSVLTDDSGSSVAIGDSIGGTVGQGGAGRGECVMMMWGSFASSLQPHVLWSRNDNSMLSYSGGPVMTGLRNRHPAFPVF